MATPKKTTAPTVVEMKDDASKPGKTNDVYAVAKAELTRLGTSDTAGRKVDKDLEDARGKDTWRAHIQLVAAREQDDRAAARHDEATTTHANQFNAIQKKADANHSDVVAGQKKQFDVALKAATDNHKATLKTIDSTRDAVIATLDEHHSEAISLAEQQSADAANQMEATQATVVGEIGSTRDQILNGQAILGEAVTTAQRTASKESDAVVKLVENLNKSVQIVHESLARSQDQDGKTMLETLQAQHEATLELVKNIHADLDTKMAHFREEINLDLEKADTTSGNQHAALRGDLNVVLSLLSDIRKDQIGRPDRR